jgi:hypothetical protein
MQWQTEKHLHESIVINMVIKRQNKQDTTYDKGRLCQTARGNNNEIRGFSDQGGATVVVAAGTSVSLTLPFSPSVFLYVK